jgi:hypothetical protein
MTKMTLTHAIGDNMHCYPTVDSIDEANDNDVDDTRSAELRVHPVNEVEL